MADPEFPAEVDQRFVAEMGAAAVRVVEGRILAAWHAAAARALEGRLLGGIDYDDQPAAPDPDAGEAVAQCRHCRGRLAWRSSGSGILVCSGCGAWWWSINRRAAR